MVNPNGDDWLDLSKVRVTRKGQPKDSVRLRYPAMVYFPVESIAIVEELCRLLKFKVVRPWGFRFRQEPDPNRLLLLPLETEDERGLPLVIEDQGNAGQLNLRAVYAALYIATYPETTAVVPIAIEEHPKYGFVLAYKYGDQTLERVRRRQPKPNPG